MKDVVISFGSLDDVGNGFKLVVPQTNSNTNPVEQPTTPVVETKPYTGSYIDFKSGTISKVIVGDLVITNPDEVVSSLKNHSLLDVYEYVTADGTKYTRITKKADGNVNILLQGDNPVISSDLVLDGSALIQNNQLPPVWVNGTTTLLSFTSVAEYPARHYDIYINDELKHRAVHYNALPNYLGDGKNVMFIMEIDGTYPATRYNKVGDSVGSDTNTTYTDGYLIALLSPTGAKLTIKRPNSSVTPVSDIFYDDYGYGRYILQESDLGSEIVFTAPTPKNVYFSLLAYNREGTPLFYSKDMRNAEEIPQDLQQYGISAHYETGKVSIGNIGEYFNIGYMFTKEPVYSSEEFKQKLPSLSVLATGERKGSDPLYESFPTFMATVIGKYVDRYYG